MVKLHGAQMLRYKGVLNIKGENRRAIFQGVHMLMTSEFGAPWKKTEKRESRMVFIGRDLPKDLLLDGLSDCAAGAARASLPI
ncbi:MAG TPA: GTP-binding protein, partial [Telluria sp.]|jgi:G3E family GTPase